MTKPGFEAYKRHAGLERKERNRFEDKEWIKEVMGQRPGMQGSGVVIADPYIHHYSHFVKLTLTIPEYFYRGVKIVKRSVFRKIGCCPSRDSIQGPLACQSLTSSQDSSSRIDR